MILIALHEILCSVMLYGAFCRLVRVNHMTKLSIRFGFFLIGFSACAGITMPFRDSWIPSLFELSLMLGVVTMQMVTAHRWANGVPAKFQVGEAQ